MFRALSTFAVISTDFVNLKLYFKIYGIDARVFSNTLDGDYNSSPSDTLATRGGLTSSTLAGGGRGPAVHEVIIRPIGSQH